MKGLLKDLLAWDTLLAAGVCLVLLGLVVRGLARQANRDVNRRKQHQAAERRADAPTPIDNLNEAPTGSSGTTRRSPTHFSISA